MQPSNLSYSQAAFRHRNDADLLESNTRTENSSQLYGLASECALKAIMQSLGMEMTSDGKPKNRNHGHINKLWDEFHIFVNSKNQAKLSTILGTTNPFANWTVDHRYYTDNSVSPNELLEHRKGTLLVFKCLGHAIADGVVNV